MGGGGKKGGAKTRVVDYYLSVHYAVAHTVDAITRIVIKDKTVWEGRKTDPGPIVIDLPDKFGGNKKEGGPIGVAYFLPGNATQKLPAWFASKLKYGDEQMTPDTAPGYRGLSTVVFTGKEGAVAPPDGSITGDPSKLKNSKPGFIWISNNPYLPGAWIEAERISRGLSSAYDTIRVQRGVDKDGDPIYYPREANPAHIIYECLTNTDWGMGAPTGILDVGSMESAAEIFWNEKFGLSLMWAEQTTIEAFVTEILDHVQATLFVSPRTGKLTLKPIRKDYEIDDLPVFTPDNAKLSNFQRKAWGETINEIVITWTNWRNQEEETITGHDLANIAIQGLVSDGRNYYGIRRKRLAADVLARDLRSAAYPLAICELETDRRGWDLQPGDCLVLTWPEYGVDRLVMRVGKIDYGRPGASSIKAQLTEDIFGLEAAEYSEPPGTSWVNPDQDPEPLDFVQGFVLPAPLVQRAGISDDSDFPDVLVGILGSTQQSNALGFELVGEKVLANGNTVPATLGERALTGRGALQAPLVREASSTVASFGTVFGGEGPELAGIAIIGGGTDEQCEMVMLDAYAAGTWTLARGIFDTVPRAWPAGTPVWFIGESWQAVDAEPRPAPGDVDYKLRTIITGDKLPLAQANELTVPLIERPYLPFRPANVKINGSLWGPVTLAVTDTMTITWSRRNRTKEDSIIRRWTDADLAPEADQTVTVEVLDVDRHVIMSYPDLTGTTFSPDLADFSTEETAFIRVLAVNAEGDRSLQAIEIPVTIVATDGYGANYGNSYGTGA